MLIVQPCEFIETGDGYYRMHEPMRQLGRLPGIRAVDVHYSHPSYWKWLQLADVLVLPFFNGGEYFPLIEWRRRQAKVTVFETNDYFEGTQPWNPIQPYWQDPETRAHHLEYIRACDAVQTSCERLAGHWRENARRVAVFRNHLVNVPGAPARPPRPLTIGWGGSQGHLADWLDCCKTLQPWLEAHPEINVSVMTHRMGKDFLNLPASRYSFRDAGAIEDYEQFLDSFDIGIVPLLPNEYNRCRSDVKFLEYAAHRIAGVYAALPDHSSPYAGVVEARKTGLLYHNSQELVACLEELVAKPELAQTIRQAAYEYVVNQRNMPKQIQERVDFYRALLPNAHVPAAPPPELFASAKTDHAYYRFELDADGQIYIDAAQAKDEPAALEKLDELLHRHPSHVNALQVAAKIANNLKQLDRAQSYLKRARELTEFSAQTLAELGRSQFLRGESAAARHSIEQAITLNGAYIPAWAYLVNIARAAPQPDAALIVQRVQRRHPDNYKLGLQAASLLPRHELAAYLHALAERTLPPLSREQIRYAQKFFMLQLPKYMPAIAPSAAALAMLDYWAKFFPHSPQLLHFQGEILRRLGRWSAAAEKFKRALELRDIAEHYREECRADSLIGQYWQLHEHISESARD